MQPNLSIYLKSFLLGLLQGLTEFLPISSSGHLILFQNLIHFTENALLFNVFLHLGTLLAVFLVYKNDIAGLFKNFKMCVYLIVGTIPAVIVGFLFHNHIETIFAGNITVAGAYFLTALWLYLGHSAISKAQPDTAEIDCKKAVLIGIAQAVAIIPGISRAGATIVSGIFLGLERKEAAKFSFLLSIPAVLGAVVLESTKMETGGIDIYTLLIGVAAAAFSGYLAIKLLLKILVKGKLAVFSCYCFILGIVILLFFA